MFEIKKTLSFNSEDLTIGSEYDYITRTSQNQGILQETGFVNKQNINSAGNWSLGLLQMDFFYRQKPWYAGQFVRKIIPKIKLNSNLIKFFTVSLNKLKPKLLTLAVRHVEEIFLKSTISLPTKNGEIDFDFMEEFIGEIEREKLEILEKYLEENGLKDCELTSEEEKVLSDFESGKIEWGEFRIEDVFEIKTYKKRFDANKIDIGENGNPYVVRTALNNGIRGYIDEDIKFLNEGNTISFGQDTATMFYQEKPYFTGDKIKILKSKNNNFNKINGLFFVSSMTKSFSSFTWGSSSFNINIIGNQIIQLPIKNGEPDFGVMGSLIGGVEKMVVRGLVGYVGE